MERQPTMHLVSVILPLALFFGAFKLFDIFVATGVLVVAVVGILAVQWFTTRKVSRMSVISAALVLVFGGITVAFRDPIFLQWKVSIINWLFALAFGGSVLIAKRPLVRTMMEELVTDSGDATEDSGPAIVLTDRDWSVLNALWASFFGLIGIVNLIVAYRFDEDTWVKFKVFGITGALLAFSLTQAFWIASKMPADEEG